MTKLKNINLQIPGKLFLSGEWSILNNNNYCIVFPINKFLKIQITTNKKIRIKTKKLFKNKETLQLLKTAINIAIYFLKKQNISIQKFKINIKSEISTIKLNNSYSKIGLGSSAATIVGIISGILKFHNLKTSKEIIFKLSSIANLMAQKKIGSCADIACCVYQEPISYKKFDSKWLIKKLKKDSFYEIIKEKWPNLEIKNINIPKNLNLLVGFSGKSCSTKNIIPTISKSINFRLITSQINNIVIELIKMLNKNKNNYEEKILKLISQNRVLLKKLNSKLETKELTNLINIANKHNAAAKFSGAGCGDCGIAICFDKTKISKIKQEWKLNNIYPINVKILSNKNSN